MDLRHYTIVNNTIHVRQPITESRQNLFQVIRKKAIKYVSKIKQRSLKGRICWKKGFHINFSFLWCHTSNTTVFDTGCPEYEEIETVSEVKEVLSVSLDPHRSNLPTEIRLRIWRACWEPRRVEVHHFIQDRDIDNNVPFSTSTFRSTAPLPITLRICGESRLETLRHYSLAFASRLSAPQIYFNFDIDCLYIREADMFLNPSFVTVFPVTDVKRVKRLAVPDMYVQFLIRQQQRSLSVPHGTWSLARKLLECGIHDAPSMSPNIWTSLKELDILMCDERNQRKDRNASWIKDGLYICAHCVKEQVESSFSQWLGGPKVAVSSFRSNWRPFDVNPRNRSSKPIIRREAHIMYAPCCRIRPDELLVSLRNLDYLASKTVVARIAKFFGIQIHRYPKGVAPCRCRVENYILSEGISSWATRYRFTGRDRGELGILCKKWLHYIPYFNVEPIS